MINHKTYLIFIYLFSFILGGCEKFSDKEIYQRPDWLPGKLYTTVSVQENLTMFTECLRLTGLDSLIDVSGSWTVFAPTDEAMKQYLSDNRYASISDIPLNQLEKIAKFHIIQNPWSLEQLQSLSAFGWRTKEDGNLNSYAYKRQTILKNKNEKYWIKRANKKDMIVTDSTSSDGYKKVFVESRKYVPVFYDLYLTVNGITSGDYNFYFGRSYEPGNVYFAGARILKSDIFAENGFVHIIDRVVNPMLNAKEILEREIQGETYKYFLEMVYWYYPTFEVNMAATINQPEVRHGGVVDTLWDLNYSQPVFAIQDERTGYEGSFTNLTLVAHNGMIAPTDDAFGKFVDHILTIKSGFPHWRDFQSLPQDVVQIIISPHFKANPIYPSSKIYRDFFKVNGGFKQNEGDIIRAEFGSNCTFIGVNSYSPNRVFTSVTGPVFLRPVYSYFRKALLYAGIEDDIAYSNNELCFFPIPDYALKADSSMLLNWIDEEQNRYNFEEYNRTKHVIEPLARSTITNRILNHVGTSLPNGSANKEFILNMKGNYIIWNNTDNTVQGNLPCTIGYNGNIVQTCNPVSLNEPADNGKSWSVNYWFNFGNNNMRTVLFGFPKFYSLLNKAGFLNSGSFIYENKNYTVFAPSDEAITNSQADKLSMEDLRTFLKNHFLQGKMIFTDNKQPSGNYQTVGGSTLNVQTSPDLIEILDKAGNPYIVIPENEKTTNIMVTQGSAVSSVVHEIDKVLIR